MSNPLFKGNKNLGTVAPNDMDINKLREAVNRQDPSFLNSMVKLAKQRGIKQSDIDAGLRMLKGI